MCTEEVRFLLHASCVRSRADSSNYSFTHAKAAKRDVTSGEYGGYDTLCPIVLRAVFFTEKIGFGSIRDMMVYESRRLKLRGSLLFTFTK